MGCCSRRRALLASGSPARAARAVPAVLPSVPPRAGVRLRFVGARPVRVEGAVSGRIYRASPADRLVTASQEDVRSLVRSGLFVRVPGI